MSGIGAMMFGNRTPPAVAAGGGDDPYFANVTFLVQGGTNGSTTITDLVSTNPATITSQGSLAWSDTVTKYAATSLSFNGTSQAAYIDYNNTNWDMSGNFTWEIWAYSTTASPNSGYRLLLGEVGSGTGGMYMGENQGAYWDLYTSGGTSLSASVSTGYNPGGYNSGTGWVANTWQHHALTRSGSNFTYWIDGTALFTFTSGATPKQNGWAWLGADGGTSSPGTASNSWWKGYIGGIRFTKGVARYSSTFTPPIAAFPTS